jgi:hypothetical protein
LRPELEKEMKSKLKFTFTAPVPVPLSYGDIGHAALRTKAPNAPVCFHPTVQ